MLDPASTGRALDHALFGAAVGQGDHRRVGKRPGPRGFCAGGEPPGLSGCAHCLCQDAPAHGGFCRGQVGTDTLFGLAALPCGDGDLCGAGHAGSQGLGRGVDGVEGGRGAGYGARGDPQPHGGADRRPHRRRLSVHSIRRPYPAHGCLWTRTGRTFLETPAPGPGPHPDRPPDPPAVG